MQDFYLSFSSFLDTNGEMQYTVLWLPSRYRQLYCYLFLLLAIPVALLARYLLLRWFAYKKISGSASR